MPTPLTDADKVLRNDTGKDIVEKLDDIAQALGVGVNADQINYDNTDSGLEATDVQEAIDEVNDKFVNTKTITNVSIASFTDGAKAPVKSLTTLITPTQAGTGTPSPSNPLLITGFDSVDVVVNSQNYIDFSTAQLRPIQSGSSTQRVGFEPVVLPAGTYHIKKYPAVATQIYVTNYDDGTNIANSNTQEFDFTITESTNVLVRTTAQTMEQFTLTALLCVLKSDSTTHTITLPETIYGGNASLTDGNGTKTHNYITLNGSEDWTEYASGKYFAPVIPANDNKVSDVGYLSNLYPFEGDGASSSTSVTVDKRFYMQRQYGRVWLYDSSITSLSDLQTMLSSNNLTIVYPLTTPTAFTFTGANIPTLSGTNNIYSNTGNIQELTYFTQSSDKTEELIKANVDKTLSDTSENSVQNKVVNYALALKADKTDLDITTSITTPAPIQTFTDGGDNIPVKSLVTEIKAQQDLHGYSNPWAGGGGKNKLPFYTNDEVAGITYTVDSKGVITATGQATGNSRIAQYVYLPAGNYILSGSSSTSSSGMGDMYITKVSDGTVLARDYTNISEESRKFTLTETTRIYVAVRFSNGATSSSSTKIFYPQIETGTSATTYEPYANVCPITGFSSVDVIRQGKNILDSSICNRNYTSPYTFFRFGGTNVDPVDGSLYLAKGTYTFSISTKAYVIRALDKNNETIEVAYNANKLTFTLTESQKCMLNIAISGDVQISDFTFQLELGEDVTTYEAYKGTTHTITLPETIYGGTAELVGGNGVKKYGYIEFDGSSDENWSYNSTYNWFYTNFPLMKVGTLLNGITNYLPNSTSYSQFGCGFGRNNNNFYCYKIIDNITGVTDLESWKTYLSNNPLQVVYPLATPTAFTFTGANIATLSGENNIYSNTGDVEVEYFNSKADWLADLIRAMTRS